MALILIATAGASNANSYCTAAEGETYHEKRLHIEDWSGASTSEREAALVWASRLLDDSMDWYGWKNSSAQAMRWPRSGVYGPDGYPITSTAIPSFLRDATAEYARLLIAEDRTLETNRDLKGYKMMQIGDLKIVIDPTTGKPVTPKSVWQMIREYCVRIGRKRTLIRV